MNVVRALHRAPDRHTVRRVGNGEHAVRLDVELFLRAGLVFTLDHDRCGGERGVDITLADAVSLEEIVFAPDDLAPLQRLIEREHRRQRLEVDRDPAPRLLRTSPIAVCDQQYWFFPVIDDLRREVWLIAEEQLDRLVPGMSAAVTIVNSSQSIVG